MKNIMFIGQFVVIASAGLLLPLGSAWAQLASTDNVTYSALPPTSSESAPPIVMLTMSRDHQYFFKAYSDFSDLDPENNDGVETTYKNNFDYYGYFQSDVCYNYTTVSGVGAYVPAAVMTAQALPRTTFYCDDVTGDWSGNFLNWVTMTRMDIIRKVLYGGKRKVDTGSLTLLERAYLPPDGHAYTKYYNGDDIAKLTPFSVAAPDSNGLDDIDEGLTICNVTQFDSATVNGGSSPDVISHNNTNPPVMRFAEGNYKLWSSNERVNCAWGRFGNSNRGPSNPVTISVAGANSGSGATYNGELLATGDVVDVDSGIDAYGNSPAAPATGTTDYQVHVVACTENGAGAIIDIDSCVQYPDGNYKPIGLLQTYGEKDLMSFGLMTGSYTNNLQGGALRKNVASFSDEVNVDDDGTFVTTATESIVQTLDSVRISQYRYTNTNYSDCGGNRADLTYNGPCSAWGNPISEIYRDSLLYLAGVSTPSHSSVDDSGLIPGLETATWETVLNEDNQCSDLNNIVFNGSVSTYDNDATEISLALLPGAGTDTWTNIIGADEGIHGAQAYVGNNGADNSDLCTAKTITNLSDVTGLCPEGPSKEGSYALAGLAYYAHNTDLDTTLDGDQVVNTFGISLASSSPVINVPIVSGASAGNEITIIPSGVQSGGGSGALVDFQIVKKHALMDDGSGRYFGKFYVSYEVSVAGNDYDVDASGTIEYVLDETNNEITITTVALLESAGSTAGLFGFVVGGTTEDGFHAYSGDASGSAGADYTDPSGVPGCSNCRSLVGRNGGLAADVQFGPQSHTFTIGGGSVNAIEPPLYYAAKWGNFEDNDADGKPNLDAEWDRQNNFTGTTGSDGIPDDYFFVSNPAQLEEAVSRTLSNILAERESSGTAPANLANADGTGGIIVQALYYESEVGSADSSDSAAWTGEIKVFFIDEYGFYREDGNGNGQLDDTVADPVFVFNYDAVAEQLNIVRFQFTDPALAYDATINPLDTVNSVTVEASELRTIWSGDDFLSSLDNGTIETQRNYDTVASTTGASRYILTWFDRNRDYIVDAGEQVDFDENSVELTDSIAGQNAEFARYFGSDVTSAKNIVNFVRGKEGITGYRNRVVTNSTGAGNIDIVKRLGDVVNSTPLIVGAPNFAYDTRYGDTSYTEFRLKYQNRRQVTYVGANDGLLHAFNGGFRQSSTTSTLSFSTANPDDATTGETTVQHELGAELWAYAPNNLLPHLRYLTDPYYLHTFYVDGQPTSYDVNIFDDTDPDHPNGWGTILVVGMRLGGGQIGVNLDDDNSTDISDVTGPNSTCKDWCARSSYIVLDITNPENPPEIIAEVNDNLLATLTAGVQTTDVGNDVFYTSQVPALVRSRSPGSGNNWLSPSTNEWKLVFGSGPESVTNIDTDETAKLYTFDLNSLDLNKQNVKSGTGDVNNSFVGGLVSVDWNNDYNDDIVYFGTVGKDPSVTTVADDHIGSLFRYRVADDDTNLFYDADRPISTKPFGRTSSSRNFVYFGTGRYLYEGDVETSNQEKYYGIMEPDDTYAVTVTGGILDVDAIVVDEDGELTNAPVGADLDSNSIVTFNEFQTYITTDSTVNGWSRDFDAAGGAIPSERVTSDSTSIKTQLFYTSFTPTDNICSANSGTSSFTVLDLVTGTASDFGGLGFDASGNAITSVSLGNGRASLPQVLTASGLGSNKGRAVIQLDTGELVSDPDGVDQGAIIVTLGVPVDLERINWREIRND